MPREFERKFFFTPSRWTGKLVRSVPLDQGYLADTGTWEIRLRRAGTDCRYTMKTGAGLDRDSWDTRIDGPEFDALWPKTDGRRIVKVRDKYETKGPEVEVDRFSGSLAGLTVAEVEFATAAEARTFAVPRAFGPELTYDPRYKNRALAESPQVPRKVDRDGTWAYGVLPYRQGLRGLEMVVVTNRRQDRWIFPKGHPEPRLTAERVALNEAREEAGISGKVTGHPIVLPYVRETGTVNLLLYPVLITGLSERWLELGQRERQIIRVQDAEAYGDVVRWGADCLKDRYR